MRGFPAILDPMSDELTEKERDVRAAEEHVVDTLRSLDVAPERIERYGIYPEQYIEWYGPREGKRVVLIHGGYFHEDGTLSYLRPAACALGEEGYCVALAEYRHVNGDPSLSFADMALLASYENLHEAIWIGHSTGAVLALHALFNDSIPVKRAVVLSPIFDMARAAQEDALTGLNPTAQWMGGMPEDKPDTYAAWEPLGLYSEMEASGFQQRALRLDVIHGTLDHLVPVARTRDLMGEPFNIAIVSGEKHNDVIRPGSDSWLLLLGTLE